MKAKRDDSSVCCFLVFALPFAQEYPARPINFIPFPPSFLILRSNARNLRDVRTELTQRINEHALTNRLMISGKGADENNA
jgi:hypothetical protein